MNNNSILFPFFTEFIVIFFKRKFEFYNKKLKTIVNLLDKEVRCTII